MDDADNPFPKDLRRYAPHPLELVEFWAANPMPCEEGEPANAVDVPRELNCRLDRLVLRDSERNVEFRTTAAHIDFDFLYYDKGKSSIEDNPRPLDQLPWKTFGFIALKGTVGGKSYLIVRHITGGAPSEVHASIAIPSRRTGHIVVPLMFEGVRWAPLKAAELPVVTIKTAQLYNFDLKNGTPAWKDGGGPLKDFKFEPYRCR